MPPEEGFSFRLMVDLTPSTREAFAAAAGWPQALDDRNRLARRPRRSLLPPSRGEAEKRLVVIDAGHGGIDPGTQGRSGIREKDLVLGVARELRKALEATGTLSRATHARQRRFHSVARTGACIARAAHADLFVSLHADSNDHRDIRGASVYTLSEDASDREAATLAEKENMSDVIAGVDLAGENSPVASILIDLAQRDTMNRSVRFAERVLTALPRATMVRPTSPHRSAGFAVLKAPDIPAVLVELGYLSNSARRGRDDEAGMASESGGIAGRCDRWAFFGRGRASGRQAAVP